MVVDDEGQLGGRRAREGEQRPHQIGVPGAERLDVAACLRGVATRPGGTADSTQAAPQRADARPRTAAGHRLRTTARLRRLAARPCVEHHAAVDIEQQFYMANPSPGRMPAQQDGQAFFPANAGHR